MPDSAASPHTCSGSHAWLSLAASVASEIDADAWLADGETRLQELADQADRILGEGRGAARAVTLPAMSGTVAGVWRVNRHGGLLGGLQADRYLDAGRLQQEVALSERLRGLGIATPEVLLALACRHGAWWRQHLVTREVESAVTVFEAREHGAALVAATALLQQVFDAGLWATDLHPGNLLWQEADGECWLIDLAGAELRSVPLSCAEREARVERFARFFVKHGGSEPDGMVELRQALLDG
jgi:hypothetical protein